MSKSQHMYGSENGEFYSAEQASSRMIEIVSSVDTPDGQHYQDTDHLNLAHVRDFFDAKASMYDFLSKDTPLESQKSVFRNEVRKNKELADAAEILGAGDPTETALYWERVYSAVQRDIIPLLKNEQAIARTRREWKVSKENKPTGWKFIDQS